MGKALVILSGGQDSVTSMFWAKKRFSEVTAISFFYGQRHSEELDLAKKICDTAGIYHKLIDISSMMEVTESALINNGNMNELNAKGLPASFVPNRNQLFITLAHAYAQLIGYGSLIIGVSQSDYSGYPDCRNAFISSIETSSNLGSAEKIKIYAPMMFLDKADTFLLADDLGILDTVLESTMTCYNGITEMNEWGMGCDDCPACGLRKKGYYAYRERYK